MSGSGSTYFILGHTFEQMTDYWVMNNLKTTTKGVIAVEPQNLP